MKLGEAILAVVENEKTYKASKNAWKHAREITKLSNREISFMAGWVLRTGKKVGVPTRNAWVIARGRSLPTIPSLIRILNHSEAGHKFVMAYFEGLTWLARD